MDSGGDIHEKILLFIGAVARSGGNASFLRG
jgi:hypothetical protein